ncbi:uncharacterized protein I303_106914 [Kwoniella dejecticola CBS 10117]|uniref:FAD/NAD(P)-binding domain-containing protein n=1 Tax=Kwoniella dejecticola CBS 10117 TaxID=1296121 RepID=A0AAJ8KTZ1_9TREE
MTIAVKPSVLIIAYEARDAVGGLWNFDPDPAPCTISFDEVGHAIALSDLERQGKPAPTPTPMYAGVTANTPRDIMPYRSHPYPDGTAENPTYETIYEYQVRHAQRYSKYIQLNRTVTRVRHTPANHSPRKRWLVEWTPSFPSSSPDVGKNFEEQFDHIVVANGTDSRPFIPYINGLWEWKGEIIHSRWYRKSEAFADKAVMVVGGGADIVRELGMLVVNRSTSAPRKIYRSFRSKLRYDTEQDKGWPDHVANLSPMDAVHPPSGESRTGRIVTISGEVVDDVDVIIFATAYIARFEFLRDTDPPFNNAPLLRYPQVPKGATRPPTEAVSEATLEGGHRVHNLDSHQLFYLPDPTLAFLLLHAEAIPWPFSEMQARVLAAHWSGTPLELEPHPDENNDSHSVLILGHPGEFDYAENLLKLIGEGGPEEVDSEGKWGAWPEWKKHIRALID